MSAHIDLVKETAYQIWIRTRKPFCAVDVFNEVWLILKGRGEKPITPREVGMVLRDAPWAKRKCKAGGLSYSTYTWRGD